MKSEKPTAQDSANNRGHRSGQRSGRKREKNSDDRRPQDETENVFLVSGMVDPEQMEDELPEYEPGEVSELRNVVEVKFHSSGRHRTFDAGDMVLSKGQKIIVETKRGLAIGETVTASHRTMTDEEELHRVIRVANSNDMRQHERNMEKQLSARNLCRKLISEQSLPMKLINIEYLHGGNKAVFYFESEGRVDFRRLVRDLAQQLHVRVEMRQVGVRDATKMMGGVGPCGYTLCCSSFLQDFAPVSIRMAKEQNLVLNPQKVSGVCGRLMCCLTYEDEAYKHNITTLPKTGRTVQTPDGEGKVREIDVLKRVIRVQLLEGSAMKDFLVHEDGSIVHLPEPSPAEQIIHDTITPDVVIETQRDSRSDRKSGDGSSSGSRKKKRRRRKKRKTPGEGEQASRERNAKNRRGGKGPDEKSGRDGRPTPSVPAFLDPDKKGARNKKHDGRGSGKKKSGSRKSKWPPPPDSRKSSGKISSFLKKRSGKGSRKGPPDGDKKGS